MPVYSKEDVRGYCGVSQSRGQWVYCKDCFDDFENPEEYLDDHTQVLTDDELENDEQLFICDKCRKLMK